VSVPHMFIVTLARPCRNERRRDRHGQCRCWGAARSSLRSFWAQSRCS
jgi:hypothetical protein